MMNNAAAAQTFATQDQVQPAPRRAKRRFVEAGEYDLRRLYAEHGYEETKKATKALLEDAGFRGTREAVDGYMALWDLFKSQRESRVARRYFAKFGVLPKQTVHRLAPAKPVSAEDLHRRLKQLRVNAVERFAKCAFRYGARGGSSMRVGFAASTSAVRYEVEVSENRNLYRGKFSGWAAMVDDHQIMVPQDWRLRVRARGLALLGGLMTLDAHPLPAPDGVELFAAVWASQGRGFVVNTHRGFIAVSGDESYHGDTAEGALKGLNRKIKAQGRAPVVASLALDVDGFINRFAKYKNVLVSMSHARESGSCEFGILSWCETVGIDPEAFEVPLSVVLEGFRKRPQVEVRRAVLLAVREERAARLTRGAKSR